MKKKASKKVGKVKKEKIEEQIYVDSYYGFTRIEGLRETINFDRMIVNWKKRFQTGGNTSMNNETGKLELFFKGDHRQEIRDFLQSQGVHDKVTVLL